MKAILISTVLLFTMSFCMAQQTHVFDPNANATKDIKEAIARAQKEGKHVLVKVGYNQCPWCIKLHHFIQEDQKIDSLLKADYVLVKVNYSKENRNPEAMELLGFPQRFGFPVLVVLNEKGQRIHTQNTLYLEKDKSYDSKRIADFLKAWNRKAIEPGSYTEKK